MSFHSRGLLSAGPSKKRKEPSALYDLKPSAPLKASEPPPPPSSSNRLLAGYMAYEFLTRGTLLGRKFDPARGEAMAMAVAGSSAQPKKTKTEAEPTGKREKENHLHHHHQHQSYSEVASILKSDGAHISGIINPTQLGRWLQN